MTASELIRPQPTIQHNAYIGNALLLKFIREQFVDITRTGSPVEGAGRITRLIFAHAEEVRSGSACPRRDRPGVDARAARPDRNIAEARYGWENKQPSLRFHSDPGTAD